MTKIISFSYKTAHIYTTKKTNRFLLAGMEVKPQINRLHFMDEKHGTLVQIEYFTTQYQNIAP